MAGYRVRKEKASDRKLERGPEVFQLRRNGKNERSKNKKSRGGAAEELENRGGRKEVWTKDERKRGKSIGASLLPLLFVFALTATEAAAARRKPPSPPQNPPSPSSANLQSNRCGKSSFPFNRTNSVFSSSLDL